MSKSKWFFSECEVRVSLDAFCGMHTVFDRCEINIELTVSNWNYKMYHLK